MRRVRRSSSPLSPAVISRARWWWPGALSRSLARKQSAHVTRQDRHPSGHSGSHDPENTSYARRTPWVRDRATAAAGVRPDAASEPGDAVSCTVAPGTARLNPVRLGQVREQPARALLFTHGRWQEAVACRRGELGADDRDYVSPPGAGVPGWCTMTTPREFASRLGALFGRA